MIQLELDKKLNGWITPEDAIEIMLNLKDFLCKCGIKTKIRFPFIIDTVENYRINPIIQKINNAYREGIKCPFMTTNAHNVT